MKCHPIAGDMFTKIGELCVTFYLKSLQNSRMCEKKNSRVFVFCALHDSFIFTSVPIFFSFDEQGGEKDRPKIPKFVTSCPANRP